MFKAEKGLLEMRSNVVPIVLSWLTLPIYITRRDEESGQ